MSKQPSYADTAKAGGTWRSAEEEKPKPKEKKVDRREHRDLTPGALFIGEHYEGAGIRPDPPPPSAPTASKTTSPPANHTNKS
jgi:hypothetical protein